MYKLADRVIAIRAIKAKTKAFSLVEMLMALLVASLLLAALAPVMTKKINESIGISGLGGTINPPGGSYCWSTTTGGGSENMEYDSNGNRVVKYTTEAGVYYVNFALASGGGGGGGASEFKSENAHLTGVNNTSLKIEANMDEFDIVSVIGGGGGGGGGAAVDKSTTCTGTTSAEKCACMGYSYDSKNNLCVSNNLGSKNLANAKTACSSMSPSGKWQLPSTGQLSNWNTLYSTFGITSGQTVWSRTSGQGACSANETYNCYNNGSYRTGYSSSSACCSGSSYGQYAGTYKYCSTEKPSFWSTTSNGGSSSCTGNTFPYYCVCAAISSSSNNECKQGIRAACCGGPTSGICNRSGGTSGGCNAYCANNCGANPANKDTCLSTVTTSCSSWYTNYYYYQLSGSSWTQGYATSNTGSRSTYCVYNDSGTVGSEAFYSLSGGGGGASPSLENNSFASNILATFRQRIKENIGGYIVLEVGEGGAGGAASTGKGQKPANGKNGGASCIVITGNNKADVKYRICVPGGKFGYSGDGTKANAETTGWGAAGGETPLANSCYAIDYTFNPSGVRTEFSCTKKGNSGTAGGASTNNPTAGGKGGASVINNIQVGGTNVVNGVNAASSNYGAGGGGGSASKTGTGANGSLSFGKGGNGAGGHIYLNYKVRYDAAGGGGGGAGSVAIVREYRVNQGECTFTIGKGGAGGSVATDGKKGGDTSVTCTNSGGEVFRVYGGEGGKKGTTATTLGGYSTGGLGGLKGLYSDDVTGLPPSKLTSKTGLDGTQGGVNDSTYTNYVPVTYSAGGRGGTGGTGKKGGCGGLLNDVVCTYATDIIPNAEAIKGISMQLSDVKFPDLTQAENYGESGSGGGGGGWHMQTGSGQGGDGLGGFACIWWEKLE